MLSAALRELYTRVPFGVRLGTDAMAAACARAGNPERAFASVHIAGTNGKGSVSALTEAAARASGLRTGLYTSPHLARFAERVRISGEVIDDDALAEALTAALRFGPDLTFFEVATLASLLAFRRAGVELAVLEVGLGGRHDATNVVGPPSLRLTAITRIALDHTDRLGADLPSIAREKAGIAKAGVPLVVGPVPPEVRAAIAEVALARGALPVWTEDEPGDDEPAGARDAPDETYPARNERLARRVCRALGLDAGSVQLGFDRARWPGRFEWLETPDGPWLFDAAHNPDGAQALTASIARDLAGNGSEPSVAPRGWPPGATLRERPLALVFGALADKDFAATLAILAPLTPRRFYAEPRSRAAAPPAALAALAGGQAMGTPADALCAARAAVGLRGVVLVCGSVSLVGEARALLLGEAMDPPVGM